MGWVVRDRGWVGEGCARGTGGGAMRQNKSMGHAWQSNVEGPAWQRHSTAHRGPDCHGGGACHVHPPPAPAQPPRGGWKTSAGQSMVPPFLPVYPHPPALPQSPRGRWKTPDGQRACSPTFYNQIPTHPHPPALAQSPRGRWRRPAGQIPPPGPGARGPPAAAPWWMR